MFAIVDDKTYLFGSLVPVRVHDQYDLEQDYVSKLVLLLGIKPKSLICCNSCTFCCSVVN